MVADNQAVVLFKSGHDAATLEYQALACG
jgi:hypothetical protein